MNEIKLPPEFRSGNGIHVERATVTRERMVEILAEAIEAGRAALQSQDADDAERYRWLRDSALLFSQIEQRGVSGWMIGRRDHVKARFYTYNGKELDEAIDHARRVEGGGE